MDFTAWLSAVAPSIAAIVVGIGGPIAGYWAGSRRKIATEERVTERQYQKDLLHQIQQLKEEAEGERKRLEASEEQWRQKFFKMEEDYHSLKMEVVELRKQISNGEEREVLIVTLTQRVTKCEAEVERWQDKYHAAEIENETLMRANERLEGAIRDLERERSQARAIVSEVTQAGVDAIKQKTLGKEGGE